MIAGMLAREEWPLVWLGVGVGMLWALVSLVVAVQLNELLRPDSVLGVAKIVALFPAAVAAWIGETAYRAGVPDEAAALVAAWIAASIPPTAALVAFARR